VRTCSKRFYPSKPDMAKELADYALTGAPSYTFARPDQGDTVTLYQGETTAAVGLDVASLDAETRKAFTRTTKAEAEATPAAKTEAAAKA